MKMKLTLLFIALTSFFVQAQNKEACTETNLMSTSVKSKRCYSFDYLTTLRKDCPSFHKSILHFRRICS